MRNIEDHGIAAVQHSCEADATRNYQCIHSLRGTAQLTLDTLGASPGQMIYESDLAYIHHVGFGDLARGAASYVARQLREAGINDGMVVDLGCGSGALAAELSRSGYRVLGVDSSDAMIQLAKQTAPDAEFVFDRISTFQIPRCVAVCSIGEGLTYILDERGVNLAEVFTRVFDSLVPSGLLIFDFIECGDVPMSYRSEKSGSDWHVLAEVSEDPLASVITRKITTTREVGGAQRRSVEVHRVQALSRDDLRSALASSGFTARLDNGYGEIAVGTRRVVVTAVKSSA